MKRRQTVPTESRVTKETVEKMAREVIGIDLSPSEIDQLTPQLDKLLTDLARYPTPTSRTSSRRCSFMQVSRSKRNRLPDRADSFPSSRLADDMPSEITPPRGGITRVGFSRDPMCALLPPPAGARETKAAAPVVSCKKTYLGKRQGRGGGELSCHHDPTHHQPMPNECRPQTGSNRGVASVCTVNGRI